MSHYRDYHYFDYGPNDEKSDWDAGYQHGKRNLPHPADPSIPPYILKLLGATNRAVRGVLARRDHELNDLRARKARLEADRTSLLEERAIVSEQHTAALERLDSSIGPDSRRWLDAQTHLDLTSRRLRSLEDQLGRPARLDFRSIYFPLMIVLALAEIPINMLGFALLFREAAFFAALLSFLVGTAIVVFAHFVGLWCRQASALGSRSRIFFSYSTSAFVVLAIVIPTIYLLAKMRQGYIDLLRADQATPDLFAAPTFVAAVDAPLDLSGHTLMFVNFTVFFVGATVSFHRHDPHPDFEPRARAADDAQSTFYAIQHRYVRRRDKINYNHDTVNANYDSRLRALEREINDVERSLGAIASDDVPITEEARSILEMRIGNYQSGNLAGRTDGEMPESFQKASFEILPPANSPSDG